MEILLQLSKYAGLISTIVVPILFYIGWKKNNFHLTKNVISDCSKSKSTALLFTVTLIIFASLEFAFSTAIIVNLLSKELQWLVFPPFIALIGFITAAIITNYLGKCITVLYLSIQQYVWTWRYRNNFVDGNCYAVGVFEV